MNKKFFAFLSTLLLGLVLLAPSAFAQSTPVGTWKTIDDETGKAKSYVKIYESKGKLYGKVTKLLLKPGAKCTECSGKNKNKPIEGMLILWNLKKDGDEYEDGTILDPSKGKTYDAKIWLDGKKLKVRGYIGFLYRTQTWIRVK